MKITRVLFLFVSLCITCSQVNAQTSWQRPKPADGSAFGLPKPAYQVRVSRSQMIPMRDGVRLSADIYAPVDSQSKRSVIYIVTPYGKHLWDDRERLSYMFAGQGYIVVVQDIRGKFESEGAFKVEYNIGPDLDDTANWIAQQPWSSGDIGMYGCSFPGQVQYYVAQERNPHLKAFIVDGGGGGGGAARWGGMNGARLGGAFMLANILPWMRDSMATVSVRPTQSLPPDQFYALSKGANFFSAVSSEVDYDAYWSHLPLSTMMSAMGSLPNDWQSYAGSPVNSDFFRGMDITGPNDTVSTPTLHINSWFDFSIVGTLYFADLFEKIGETQAVRESQYRFIHPANHCSVEYLHEGSRNGDLPLGDPRFDTRQLYLKWFKRWLDGDANAIDTLSKNTFFTTGANEWQTSDVWPPINIKPVQYFLSSESGANSRYGDGKLELKHSQTSGGRDTFAYDPHVPVYSTKSHDFTAAPSKEAQAAREMRQDVLVYTSDALKHPLQVTGRLALKLFVSSDSRDTDFTAWLVDVAPNGEAIDLQSGIMRVRYRDGWDKEVFMEDGEVYGITVDMNAVSHVFQAGHKLRVVISSSNFPMFDRNLNTGGDNFTEELGQIARNTVHFSPEYPSHMLLPVKALQSKTD